MVHGMQDSTCAVEKDHRVHLRLVPPSPTPIDTRAARRAEAQATGAFQLLCHTRELPQRGVHRVLGKALLVQVAPTTEPEIASHLGQV